MRAAWLLLLALWFGCAAPLEGASVGALADACEGCHLEQADGLHASRHGVTALGPVFLALRAQAIERRGASMAGFCDGCHLPPGGTERGLSCVSCHAAVGNLGTQNGQLALALDGPVRAPAGADPLRAPHAIKSDGFLQSAELCGTCHDVAGPAAFREQPFLLWSASPAAARGDGCKSCHPPHQPIGFDDAPEQARALLAGAIRLELRRHRSPTEDLLELRALALADGHPLPVGASFLRELSLSAWAEGAPLPPTRWLSTRLVDPEQAEVVSPLEASAQALHALQPGVARIERFSLPPGLAPGAELKACLELRRYRPELLESLGLDPALAGPVIALACVTPE